MTDLTPTSTKMRGVLRRLRPPCARSAGVPFSYTLAGRINPGYTLNFPAGEKVLAPGDGRVLAYGSLLAFWAFSTGSPYVNEATIQVILDHGSGLKTVLHGMSTIQVKTGQQVRRGDVIGTTQTSEVFFAILYNDQACDPSQINRHFRTQNGTLVVGEANRLRFAPDFTVRDFAQGMFEAVVDGFHYFYKSLTSQAGFLINIAFNGNGSKSGPAAAGIGPNDYWNNYLPEDFGSSAVVGSVVRTFSVRAELPSLGDGGPPPPIARVLPLQFNGPVYAILPTFGGKIYVSGRFSQYGNDTDGWVDAKGLCRLNLDGSLDSTFSNGTGFTITEPYYAPTQLQGTFDGGVLCGLSYNYLEERELHIGVNNVYDQMFWNGGVVPPILKFKQDGSRDADFVTDFLRTCEVTTTARILHAFHVHEKRNLYYYCYRKNVSGTSEYDGSALTMTDAIVLGSYTFAGEINSEIYWHEVDAEFRMTLLLEPELIAFCHNGPGNFGSENAVVRYVPINPWVDLTRYYYGKAAYSLWIFDFTLNIVESSVSQGLYWETRTPDADIEGMASTGYSTGGILTTIIQGVFQGSIFGGYIADDPNLPQGLANGGPEGEHKGLYHLQTAIGVNGTPVETGSGTGAAEHVFDFTLPRTSNGFRLEINPRESTINLLVIFAPGTPEETVLLVNDTRTSLQTFYFDWPALPPSNSDIRVIVNLGDSGLPGNNYSLRIWEPGHLATTPGAVFSLWDLRNGGADGFERLLTPGGYVDFDNATQSRLQVRPLWAYRDWSGAAGPYGGIDPNCGVYVSGCFDTFKGEQLYDPIRHHQLVKIKYDGSVDDGFALNLYGTDPFHDAELDASQPGGTVSKVICAVLSPDGKTLYVGGRFLNVNGNTAYRHIVALDALTGAVLT